VKKYYTYLWLRDNATPYYVGKGSGERAFTHHKQQSQCQYRPRYDSRIFVQYWESEEKAIEMEKWYIKLFGREDLGTGILHNKTEGGDGASGWIPSEETRRNMSRAGKGKPKSEEHRKKIGEAQKCRVFSEATLKRMSEAKIGKVKGENNPFFGRKHSLETIEKLRNKAIEENKHRNRKPNGRF
jgi:NUMOD3 motif